MSKGQVCKLTCTPDYAYGQQGFPPIIPGNAILMFEVELIDFKWLKIQSNQMLGGLYYGVAASISCSSFF